MIHFPAVVCTRSPSTHPSYLRWSNLSARDQQGDPRPALRPDPRPKARFELHTLGRVLRSPLFGFHPTPVVRVVYSYQYITFAVDLQYARHLHLEGMAEAEGHGVCPAEVDFKWGEFQSRSHSRSLT